MTKWTIRTGVGGRNAAFTLVELLVVVAIAAFVMAIMIPAVSAVKKRTQEATTQSFISALDQACRAYAQDNAGRYPGQDRSLQARMSASPPLAYTSLSRLTGSQVLAAAMGGYSIQDDGKFVRDTSLPVYLDIDADQVDYPMGDEGVNADLDPVSDDVQTNTGARYTIMDAFSDSMPVLYYVARSGRAGSGDEGVFAFENNVQFGVLRQYPSSTREGDFYSMVIRDQGTLVADAFDDRMYNQDSFILLSAGPDGEYFTDDDQVNFDRPTE